ncbi:MAG: glycosyltransferase family 9 protein [Candidatus Krumholzibacteriia bacterium]
MSSSSTLIIKLGAMGDVLRTTTILNAVDGPVTWVTQRVSLPLLENIPQIADLVPLDEAGRLDGRYFELAACLDDEPQACRILERVRYGRHVGAYLEDGRVRYGESAAPWYDMGLVSRFGKERADELKRLNTHSYQEHLFEMFGEEFTGQDYVFGYEPRRASLRRIGIEMRADPRWQWKRWVRYPELVERLRTNGFDVFVFEQRNDLRDFIDDINSCGLIVTGDTLTMHLGLALRKRLIAVFGPTSAPEIHDYGRLTRIVSPIECVCCYLRTCDKTPNCMDLIPLERMHAEVLRIVKESE